MMFGSFHLLRGLAVACLVLLATPALAGCISVNDLFGIPAPPAAPVDERVWRGLPGAVEAPFESVVGFRVGPDAPPLRFLPAAEPTDRASYGTGFASPLQYYNDHLLVYGPDDRLLYRGDPTLTNDTEANGTASTPGSGGLTSADGPSDAFLTILAPAEGNYTLVMYGDLGTPRVEMRVRPDAPLPQVVPLRLMHTRAVLHGDVSATAMSSIQGAGTYEAPPRMVLSWVRPVGDIAFGNFTVETGRGVLASLEIPLDSNRGGLLDSGRAIGRTPVLFDMFGLAPSMIDGGPLQWTARGLGAGAVVAQSLSVTPVPDVAPSARVPLDLDSSEVTALAGTVQFQHASWFDMPPDSRLRLYSEAPGAEVRIYDTDGVFLASRSLRAEMEDHAGVSLPAGRLVLVNDGPSAVTAEVVGRAPADASLHAVEVTERVLTVQVGRDSAPAQTRLALTAPVLFWFVATFEAPSGVQVTMERADDDELVSSLPHQVGRVTGGPPCCEPAPFFSPAGPGWQLHGGTYLLTAEAWEGLAELEVNFQVLDLAAAAAS